MRRRHLNDMIFGALIALVAAILAVAALGLLRR